MAFKLTPAGDLSPSAPVHGESAELSRGLANCRHEEQHVAAVGDEAEALGEAVAHLVDRRGGQAGARGGPRLPGHRPGARPAPPAPGGAAPARATPPPRRTTTGG